MAKYRKRPVIVEAEQFWPDKPLPFRGRGPIVEYNGEVFFVTTVHGERASLAPGDWVILEPRGLYRAYPCKPDIFEATYEAADSSAALDVPVEAIRRVFAAWLRDRRSNSRQSLADNVTPDDITALSDWLDSLQPGREEER